MSRFGVFKIQGVAYDLDDLTLDEVEAFEEICGAEFSEANFGSSKAMKAIATVLLRRNNPTITAEEIGRVKLIDFAPPDEEVPATGPPAEDAAEDASEPVAAGVRGSVASIAG